MTVNVDGNTDRMQQSCISLTDNIFIPGYGHPDDSEISNEITIREDRTDQGIVNSSNAPKRSSSPYPSREVSSNIPNDINKDGHAVPRNKEDWTKMTKSISRFEVPPIQTEDETYSKICKIVHPLTQRLGGPAHLSDICCAQTKDPVKLSPEICWRKSRSERCKLKFLGNNFQGLLAYGGCNLKDIASVGMVRKGFATKYLSFVESDAANAHPYPVATVVIDGKERRMKPVGSVYVWIEQTGSGIKLASSLMVIPDDEFKPVRADCILEKNRKEDFHLRCKNSICLTRIMYSVRPVAKHMRKSCSMIKDNSDGCA